MEEKTQKIRIIIDSLLQLQRNQESVILSNAPTVVNFLSGFNSMCYILRPDIIELYIQNHSEVLLKFGWEPSSIEPITQMRNKLFSDEDITKEYIKIELETWMQIFNKLNTENPS